MKLDSTIFYTNNLEAVVDFYQNTIGLKLGFKQEDKFASFNLESGVKLGIKKAVEKREIPGHQTFILNVDNIENLFGEFKEKGVKFYKDLTVESFGINFSVLDPDGNKVEFIERNKQVTISPQLDKA